MIGLPAKTDKLLSTFLETKQNEKSRPNEIELNFPTFIHITMRCLFM